MSDFAVITIYTQHAGQITEHRMVGETIAPGLAITPAVHSATFTGGWTVTHTPSGWAITTTNVCLPCIRRAAQHLTEADVDWTRDREIVIADPKATAAAREFGSASYDCDGSDCGWIADHLAEVA